jgi:hypothetical protein
MRLICLATILSVLVACTDDTIDGTDAGTECPVTVEPAPTWRQNECKLLCSPELGGYGLCQGTPTAPSPQLCADACEHFDVTSGHYCGGTP